MNTVAMDTHKIVKRLEQAGFNPHQAEAVTDILRETREFDLSSLATKQDLRESELRITMKLGTLITALGGVLIAIKYFG
ncbi:MAG: DUF1640 domain-containing protein [Proteobacteria bacterium]|nr:MAG: DUF1640 domain-containing protein [Pseudomonadota bacterium]